MKEITIDDIIFFVRKKTGATKIKADTDIFNDLGCVGDDFHELIDEYAKKYTVDMSDYLWYFHTNEEGNSIGGLFFSPPYRKVKRLPVTSQILFDFAISGKWKIDYPKHTIPKRRYDLLINTILVTIVFALIVYSCVK